MFSRWVAFHFPPFKIQPTRGFCLTFKLPGPSWTRSARRARPSATSSGNSVSASAMAKRAMKSSKMNCQTRNGRTETETVHRSLLKMGWRGCVGFFGGRKHILGMKAELFVAILDFWGVVFFCQGRMVITYKAFNGWSNSIPRHTPRSPKKKNHMLIKLILGLWVSDVFLCSVFAKCMVTFNKSIVRTSNHSHGPQPKMVQWCNEATTFRIHHSGRAIRGE